MTPTFYSLAGETVPIPVAFLPVLRAATKAVNCKNCTHTHYLRKPVSRTVSDRGDVTPEVAIAVPNLAVAESS